MGFEQHRNIYDEEKMSTDEAQDIVLGKLKAEAIPAAVEAVKAAAKQRSQRTYEGLDDAHIQKYVVPRHMRDEETQRKLEKLRRLREEAAARAAASAERRRKIG